MRQQRWGKMNGWPSGVTNLGPPANIRYGLTLDTQFGSLWVPFTVLGPWAPRHCWGCRWLVTPLGWPYTYLTLGRVSVR